MTTKQPHFPVIHSCAFSLESSEQMIAAGGTVVPISRILRSALDLWNANHRWLIGQGHSSLSATQYLLRQTEAPPQPQAAPTPQPMQQSPFQMAANGR